MGRTRTNPARRRLTTPAEGERPTAVKATPRKAPAIKFRGSLADVRVQASKVRQVAQGIGQRKREELVGGAVIVSLRLEKPELPTLPVKREPDLDVQLRYARDPGPEPEPFVEPTKNEGEKPAAFGKRSGKAKDDDRVERGRWASANRLWQRRREIEQANDAKYEEAMAEYRAEVEQLGAAQDEYMRLAGMSAVLGGLTFDVTLTPRQAQVNAFMPGWSGGAPAQPLLLQEPQQVLD